VTRPVLRRLGREDTRLEVDDIIAATGYKAAVSRLSFIDHSLQARVRTMDEARILDRQFELSIPGLYFVGCDAATVAAVQSALNISNGPHGRASNQRQVRDTSTRIATGWQIRRSNRLSRCRDEHHTLPKEYLQWVYGRL
jgi:hypothetical protein